jgi:hypothetical protein
MVQNASVGLLPNAPGTPPRKGQQPASFVATSVVAPARSSADYFLSLPARVLRPPLLGVPTLVHRLL